MQIGVVFPQTEIGPDAGRASIMTWGWPDAPFRLAGPPGREVIWWWPSERGRVAGIGR